MGRTLPHRDQDAPFWPCNPANKKVGFRILSAAKAAAAGALVPAVDTAAGTPDGAAITGLVQAPEQLFGHRSSPHAAPGCGCKSDPHELGGPARVCLRPLGTVACVCAKTAIGVAAVRHRTASRVTQRKNRSKHHELSTAELLQTSPVTHRQHHGHPTRRAETGARGGQTTRRTHATPSCGCGLAAAPGGRTGVPEVRVRRPHRLGCTG